MTASGTESSKSKAPPHHSHQLTTKPSIRSTKNPPVAAPPSTKKRTPIEGMSRRDDPRIFRISRADGSPPHSIMLDICVFLGIIGIILTVSITNLGEIGSSRTMKETGMRRKERWEDEARKQHEMLYRALVERDAGGGGTNDEWGCRFYLAESSIPGAGTGVFSGRYFETDEVVLTNDGLSGHLYGILQSHPQMANVGHDSDGFKALRTIYPGQELFVDSGGYDDNANSQLFHSVDEIVTDVMNHIGGGDGAMGFGSHQRKDKKDRSDDSLLHLLRKTLSRYDPTMASLLPSSLEDVKRRHRHGCAYDCLNNRTLSYLKNEGRGQCVDVTAGGVKGTVGYDETMGSGGGGVIATRDIGEGDLVGVISLEAVVVGSGDGDTKDMTVSHCFGSGGINVILCPLHPSLSTMMGSLAILEKVNSSVNSETSQSYQSDGRQNKEENLDSKECHVAAEAANAEYRWSLWNKQNDDVREWSLEQLKKTKVKNLSFDIIAKKDIKKNDKILIDIGGGESYDHQKWFIPVPKDIFPKQWRAGVHG